MSSNYLLSGACCDEHIPDGFHMSKLNGTYSEVDVLRGCSSFSIIIA